MSSVHDPNLPASPHSFPQVKLNLFHKAINLTMQRMFKARGLNITREQEAILRALCATEGVNQADLAARAGQERNNLSRTLSILESKGLVRREICAADKRNSLVYVTREGRKLHASAYEVIEEFRSVLFKGLTPAEVETFTDTIHRLTANLEHFLAASEKDGPQPGEEI